MSEDFWLWAWGAVGALIFAGPVLAMKLNSDPDGDGAADRRRRKLAVELFRKNSTQLLHLQCPSISYSLRIICGIDAV